MAASQPMLDRALTLHRAGRMAEAERLYQQLLARQPDCVQTLHRYGLLLHAAGQLRAAIDLLRRAVARQPKSAELRNDLAGALAAAGERGAAIAEYQAGLAIAPDLALLHANLAQLHLASGAQAAAHQHLLQASRLAPRDARARLLLGDSFRQRDEGDQALACYQLACQLDPSLAAAWQNLGCLHADQEDFDRAAAALTTAASLSPGSADLLANLAVAQLGAGRVGDALASSRRALAIAPTHANALLTLGNALVEAGRRQEAIRAFDDCSAHHPHQIQSAYNSALAQLSLGEWSGGWEGYELRDGRARPFDPPADLHGRRVLVVAEQGVGSQIMFLSCLSDLLRVARAVTVTCDPRLAPLVQRTYAGAQVAAHQAGTRIEQLAPSFDYVIRLGSLPRRFRNSESDFPRASAHLQPCPKRLRHWRGWLAGLGARVTVGVSWIGGRTPEQRRKRTSPLAQWRPLAQVPGVGMVCLQYGEVGAELATIGADGKITIHRPPGLNPLVDLDDLAALIAALDLVITVDNTTAHLAGAVGVETWTLLPFSADWRWLVDRDDSPWYPRMRLFRQTATGDWSSVVARVQHALSLAATGTPSRLAA
ncbi:MAG: tetratricopeptide repeat protein [Pirellulales bacterium]|nr:tetratricopeptide repeat protein [Pirellulales bacterium]